MEQEVVKRTMSGYCGRFAPSPTGPLHFGSIVSAMSSYLEAVTHQGRWVLRIDDVDQTRSIPGMDRQIIQSLEILGFVWHTDIQYQSQNQSAYQVALQHLTTNQLVYACNCSRKSWQTNALQGVDGPIYPGTCRDKNLPDKQQHALRIRTSNKAISIHDQIHGKIEHLLRRDVGDFVIRRADGCFAYQLAVVVDDHLANINHVVRGIDLLSSTPRQVYLQQQLGYPTPQYLHTPLVFGNDGKKLSKSDAAHPVSSKNPVSTLISAWQFLQQTTEVPDVDTVKDFWTWAKSHWDVNQLSTH